MSGFTKLVPEIIQSSIWNESSDVRVVWITMLATKDANGYVRGDAKTIARLANVPLQAAEEALKRFQEPDPSSHTPDNEGRRIEASPGGWIVLNHDKYRQRDHREEHASYMREWRVKKCESQVNHSSASVYAFESVEGVQGETKPDLEAQAAEVYAAYPLKVGKPAALRAIRSAIQKHGFEPVKAATEAYAAVRAGDKAYLPHPATWFNQERYNDDPATWHRSSAAPQTNRNAGTYNGGNADEYDALVQRA